jgi:hypothetical protein
VVEFKKGLVRVRIFLRSTRGSSTTAGRRDVRHGR